MKLIYSTIMIEYRLHKVTFTFFYLVKGYVRWHLSYGYYWPLQLLMKHNLSELKF